MNDLLSQIKLSSPQQQTIQKQFTVQLQGVSKKVDPFKFKTCCINSHDPNVITYSKIFVSSNLLEIVYG